PAPLALLHPHLFPTRRSSDLQQPPLLLAGEQFHFFVVFHVDADGRDEVDRRFKALVTERIPRLDLAIPKKRLLLVDTEHFSVPRSEEHTSELQSRVDLVCRLL